MNGPVTNDYVLAIDVGGTTIKALLLTEAGDELGQCRRPTPRQDVVPQLLEQVEALCHWGFQHTGQVPTAVAVASLGLVDESAGIARRSAALGWQNVPLRDLVAARTGLPTVLGQDLRAAALAEATVGLGRIEPSFLFVAIGTGVGAALVRNRLVENGVRGLAGELGHIPVPPGRFGDSRPLACGCGAVGCLETVASATALRRRFRAADGTEISAAEVAGRATAGDAVAMAVWEDLVEGLACGLVTASALLDPGHIVLGGGVALAGEQLLAPLRERLGQRYRLADPPGLSVSSLTDRAAALGAGILGWRHLRTRSPRPGAPG